jgi:RNA polymerase-binding transcription factor DksA
VSDPAADAAEIERALDDVDVALDRLRAGSYRSCTLCGAQIDDALLVADPVRATCAAHPTLDAGLTSL